MLQSRSSAYYGFTTEQRELVDFHLSSARRSLNNGMRKTGDKAFEGWSIYREPTTIYPPRTLRLHYRDQNGKLLRVISITEKGVTHA